MSGGDGCKPTYLIEYRGAQQPTYLRDSTSAPPAYNRNDPQTSNVNGSSCGVTRAPFHNLPEASALILWLWKGVCLHHRGVWSMVVVLNDVAASFHLTCGSVPTFLRWAQLSILSHIVLELVGRVSRLVLSYPKCALWL